MRINHNIAALNTYRQLGAANNAQQASMEKLSSGLRINKAGDDAAGLAISEKMRGQIRGLDMASKNAQDGISLIATAEGALNETHSILQRMRELSVQSSNDTNTADDRAEIQKEIDQLTQEIDRIGNTTEFNTKKLLNGGASVTATVTDGDADGTASNIKILGGTGDTKVGAELNISSATVATAKETTADDVFTSGAVSGSALEFTINGTAFSFAVGTSTADVVKTVNEAGIGVSASLADDDSDLVIETNAVGSASRLEVTGGLGAVSGGADATITGSTDNAAGFSNYSAQGNTVTILDGAAKGLTFELSGALADTATGGDGDTNILVGSNGTLNLQIGANEGQDMNIGITDMRASALGVSGLDVTSQTGASAAISTIDNAIKSVSQERSKLGAYQNRLDHTINNLGTSSENLTAAESRIRDVDMAKEMMEQTKNSILSQASQAMLAQANQLPQGVLQLLR